MCRENTAEGDGEVETRLQRLATARWRANEGGLETGQKKRKGGWRWRHRRDSLGDGNNS